MKVLFVQGNFNRQPKYQVVTIIYQFKNRKIVRKYASKPEAIPHLLNLKKTKKLLSKILPKSMLLPKIIKNKSYYIDFEYIDLPTLEFLIEKAIINHQFERIKDYLLIFKKLLNNIPQKKFNPYENKQFIEIFDPLKKFQSDLKEQCFLSSILDLNLNNLLFNSNNNTIYLIDWEWYFNFSIPVNYIAFRSLFYISIKLQSLITNFCSNDLPCYEVFDNFYTPKICWDMLSFSQTDIERFLFYEYNFQNSVDIVKQVYKKVNISKEKKLINQRVSLNLYSHIQNLISLKSLEVENYKKELEQAKIQIQNLENTLNMIKSSKFFKLWQSYCKIRDKILGIKK